MKGKILIIIISLALISGCSNLQRFASYKVCNPSSPLFGTGLERDIDRLIYRDEKGGWRVSHGGDLDISAIAKLASRAKKKLNAEGFCYQQKLDRYSRIASNVSKRYVKKTAREYLTWLVDNSERIIEDKRNLAKKLEEEYLRSQYKKKKKLDDLTNDFIASGYRGFNNNIRLYELLMRLLNGRTDLNYSKNIVYRSDPTAFKVLQVLDDFILFSDIITHNIIAVKKPNDVINYIDGMIMSHRYIALIGTKQYKTIIGRSKKVFLFEFVLAK